MSSTRGIAPCPRCARAVATSADRYVLHSTAPGADGRCCPLSLQHIAIDGHTPTAYVSRAHLVADLAEQVQDADPAIVWEYLTALPAAELQRLLMISLAAVPVDKTVEDIWGWVTELPAAKAVGA